MGLTGRVPHLGNHGRGHERFSEELAVGGNSLASPIGSSMVRDEAARPLMMRMIVKMPD
jgi:hypothetical protein